MNDTVADAAIERIIAGTLRTTYEYAIARGSAARLRTCHGPAVGRAVTGDWLADCFAIDQPRPASLP